MFEIDRTASHLMPAHFGPRHMGPPASGWYRDVTTMVVPYLTDSRRLADLLPAPFEVGDEPLVTVVYARNRDVDWLAGHGYNLLAVNANVVYRGRSETLAGSFSLVMWENLADPILTGRELQGIPKLYADIPDHVETDGTWTAGASHFGHQIADLRISDLREPTSAEIETAIAEGKAKDNPMGWRYLPGVGGFGTAVDEPTTFPSTNHFTEALVGSGEIVWHTLTWEQNPTQYWVVNALADLPILERRPALVTRGSTNLIVPERLPRALD